jgi:hypothetical protein
MVVTSIAQLQELAAVFAGKTWKRRLHPSSAFPTQLRRRDVIGYAA